MHKIRNVSPLGDLEVPLLGRMGDRALAAGEEVEVTDEHAKVLLLQPDNFAHVDGNLDGFTAEWLHQLATNRHLALDPKASKADVIDALTPASKTQKKG